MLLQCSVLKTSLTFIAGRRQDLPGKAPSILPLLCNSSDCDILQNACERYAHENAIFSSELNSDFDEDEGWTGVGEGMQRMQ